MATTAGERIDLVIKACGVPSAAAFARWVGIKTSQNINTFRTRNSIPAAAAAKIADKSGASEVWLIYGKGEPFPEGPVRFAEASTSELEARIAALQDQVDGALTALALAMRVFSEKLPGAAAELAPALRSVAGRRGTAQLATLAAVVEEVHAAEAAGAPRVPHRGAGRKPR